MDKEQLLFEMYKETVVTGNDIKRAELQQKYPDVNISNLHRRIVNYQIAKYGSSLNDSHTIRNFDKIARRAKERRRKKLGK